MRILIAEDDPTLANQLQQSLQTAGYAVDLAADGQEAHYKGEVESYDVIVLDLGLPRVDGLTVLRQWRASGLSTPVLILTARSNWDEKVSGIDAGADDYLTKPFHMEELQARIRALLRRNTPHNTAQWQCGALLVDTRSTKAYVNGQPLNLTSHEYRVLAVLMQKAGALVSRSELIDHIYAEEADRDSNTIDVFIGRLRKKLPPDSIETIRGMGYRMRAAAVVPS